MDPARTVVLATAAFTILTLLFLVLPMLVIVPMSFSNSAYLHFPPTGWSLQWYHEFFARSEYMDAFLNSLRIAFPVTAIASTVGTLAALGLNRGPQRGRRVYSSIMLAPLALPQIVFAIGAYPLEVRLGLAGSYMGVILGHAAVSAPLVFIAVSASLKSYRPTLELAAMTLGANWWQTFCHVTLPMIRTGLLVGAILSFSFSFDELIITLFLASPTTRTLPLILWENLKMYISPVVAAATSLVVLLTTVLLVCAVFAGRRRS